ncbi:unnamed protein product [Dicrocoelium dendriticum]|nr:unnamed protein product [Dicrocoelium dendriticum]
MCWIVAFSARPILCQSVRNATCSKNFTSQDSGSFEIPDSLESYGDHIFCNYAIKVSHGGRINITLQEVHMTMAAEILEYVVIFDGPDCTYKRIGVIFAGHTLAVVSSSNELTALFISDQTDGMRRFKEEYNLYHTDGKRRFKADYKLDNCGGKLHGPIGSFYFNGDGRMNALCIWSIKVDVGNRVHARFTKLKLDSPFAWLRVLDGDNCAAPELQLVNNTDVFTPFNCTSTTAVMTVVFASLLGLKEAALSAVYFQSKHF